MKINLEKIKPYIKSKHITVRKHPTEELYIYNYTPKCQFDKVWTEETMMCRGLILDAEGNIVARPFKKFFNLGEYQGEIPKEAPTVWEKYDGSLGILYWIGDTPYIATRGSFESDQAKKGTEILHKTCKEYWSLLDKSKTYLFEIIYPENRIVVDYEGVEQLIHIATIGNETGVDIGIVMTPFAHAISHKIDWRKPPQRDDKEGYVLQWDNGLRVKIKHDEYVRLHRLITQVTARSIWDLLRNEQPMDELIDRVPDEFYGWVKATKKNLEDEYNTILRRAKGAKMQVQSLSESRKEQAKFIMKHNRDISAVVFKMLDNKPYKDLIWKMLKPKHITPFKQEI